eukprot:m.477676 g.477676  ORF g.477676 m.477676 type:complete len:64 (-) comp20913_c0_seq1:2790-2981(-)
MMPKQPCEQRQVGVRSRKRQAQDDGQKQTTTEKQKKQMEGSFGNAHCAQTYSICSQAISPWWP